MAVAADVAVGVLPATVVVDAAVVDAAAVDAAAAAAGEN